MPRKTKEQKELENEELLKSKSVSSNAKSSVVSKRSSSTLSTRKTTSKAKSESDVSTVAKTESKSKTSKKAKSTSNSKSATTKSASKTASKSKPVTATKSTASAAKSKPTVATNSKSKTTTRSKSASKTTANARSKATSRTTTRARSKATSKSTTKSVSKSKKTLLDEKQELDINQKENIELENLAIEEEISLTEKDEPKAHIVEYYDLPYRYNQTVVKLLAQTPTTLFVYWDISDADKENFKKQYGYNFFEKTRPILIVHNDTMHYSFEVEINDFANCWYLHVNDSNCDYRIELGRKPIIGYVQNWQPSERDLQDKNSEINKYPSKPFDKNYFYITTSNKLETPNDHILISKQPAPQSIKIRNVKTNKEYNKPISNMLLKNSTNKIYNIYDLYKEIYKEENIEDIFDLSNPSSGNPSSGNPSSNIKRS